MTRQRFGAFIQRVLGHAAEGHRLALTCGLLAFAGTATAAYPVTAIVAPATLMAARRWRAIAAASALGSGLAATLLVIVFHHLGWTWIHAHFPEVAGNPAWQRVMDWATGYGVAALFLVALSPLPQTPALIVLGAGHHDYAGVLAAMLLGKLIKYGAVAWSASHFPERIGPRLGHWFRRGQAAPAEDLAPAEAVPQPRGSGTKGPGKGCG